MPIPLVMQYMLFCLSGLTTLHFIRRGFRRWQGHVWLHAVVSGVVLLGLIFNWNAPTALGIQAVLVILPFALHRMIQTALQQAMLNGKLETAGQLARLQVRLFPFGQHQQTLQLFEALASLPPQQTDATREKLSALVVQLSGIEPSAQDAMQLLDILTERTSQRDWTGLLQILAESESRHATSSNLQLPTTPPTLQAAITLQKVKALTELNRLEEGLEAFVPLTTQVLHGLVLRQSWLGALSLLALGGRREAVQKLLSHPLRQMKMEPTILWLARAAWGAGAFDEARSLLTSLGQRPDVPEVFRVQLQERLQQLEQHPPAHSFTSRELLDRLERFVALEIRLFPDMGELLTRRPATTSLLGVLVAVELGTLISGHRLELTAQFGAFGLLLRQEPWRLVTGLLLQTSPFHLVAVGIPALWWGGSLEGLVGSRRAGLLFAVCGLLGLWLGATLFPQLSLVGADAGLASWLGARLALSFWGRGLSVGQQKRLRDRLPFTLGLLLLLELVSPHTSGTGIGLGIGLGLLAGAWWSKQTVTLETIEHLGGLVPRVKGR